MAKSKTDRRMILFTFDPNRAWSLGEGVNDGREVPPFTHIPPLQTLEAMYEAKTGRTVNRAVAESAYEMTVEHAKELRIKLPDGSIVYESEVLCPNLEDFERIVAKRHMEVTPVTLAGRDENGKAIIQTDTGAQVLRTKYDADVRKRLSLDAMVAGLAEAMGFGEDDLPDGLAPDQQEDEQEPANA